MEYWRTTDPEAIARALEIPPPIIEVRFEAQLPTELRGTPPTLDLLLVASATRAWGIESKYTEPFQLHKNREPFTPSYFRDDSGLWTRLGLPRCQRLAEQISRGQKQFFHLDVPQLLKHSLGIRHAYVEGQLLYLWFDINTPDCRLLAKEIETFASLVDEVLGFRSVTHQEVFSHLSAEPTVNPAYVTYMRNRYFVV